MNVKLKASGRNGPAQKMVSRQIGVRYATPWPPACIYEWAFCDDSGWRRFPQFGGALGWRDTTWDVWPPGVEWLARRRSALGFRLWLVRQVCGPGRYTVRSDSR